MKFSVNAILKNLSVYENFKKLIEDSKDQGCLFPLVFWANFKSNWRMFNSTILFPDYKVSLLKVKLGIFNFNFVGVLNYKLNMSW